MKKFTLDQFKDLLVKTVDGIKELKNKPRPSLVREEHEKPKKGMSLVKDGEVMRVEIAPASVAKGTATILLVLAVAYFLMQISAILVLFFVSFLLTAGLDRTVSNLYYRYKVPRALSVIVFYILILSVLALLVSNMAPLVADQVSALSTKLFQLFQDLASGNSKLPFAEQLEPYFQKFNTGVDINSISQKIQDSLRNFSNQLLSFGGNIWSVLVFISNGLLNASLVLVITFFMIVEWESIEDFFISLFPSKHTSYIVAHLEQVKTKIGFWLRGQLLLSLSIGVITYIGLLIIGMDYALTLALVAGITEMIPVVGPILALLLALPVAANISLWMLVAVIILYLVIQQIEGNILVPLVMKKTVGLSPIIVMFAMLVGYQYLGILGIIFSIPVAACTAIFVKDYAERVK